MKKRVAALSAGLLALGAIASWFALRPAAPEVTAAPAPLAATQEPAAVQAAAVRDGCRFEQGAQLSYEVRLRTATRQATPGLGAPTAVELDLSGQLDLEVLSVRPHDAVVAGRLALAAQAGKPTIDVEAFRAPFLVAIDSRCQLAAFARWDQTAAPVARNQQAMLWDAQFRLGAAQLRLADASGIALAELQATPGAVKRTLVRYESTWPGEAVGLSVQGAMDVQLGEGPWFEALESRREQRAEEFSNVSVLTLARGAGRGVFTAEERVEARYVWADLLPRQPRLELAARPFTRFDQERHEQVRGQTVTQALEAFKEKARQGGGTQSKWPELSAYFEVHPEALRPAYERYLAGELPASSAGDFFLALSKTRNDEARELLLSVKRDDRAIMMDQVRAMFALVTRTDVGLPLAQELASDVQRHLSHRHPDSDFLAGEAMLALSTMSGLRSDAALMQTSRQALESVLESEAPTGHPARVALRAIGNTGDPALLPRVMEFSRSDDVATRKAAAHGFSRMPPEASDKLELEWLRRETNPFVKKELYRVLQQQHYDLQQGASRELVEHTLRELPTTKSAYVRKSMVFLIAQSAVAQEPDIRRALVNHARWERAKGSPVLNQFGSILTRDERAEVLR